MFFLLRPITIFVSLFFGRIESVPFHVFTKYSLHLQIEICIAHVHEFITWINAMASIVHERVCVCRSDYCVTSTVAVAVVYFVLNV